jgi:hypothetical protein
MLVREKEKRSLVRQGGPELNDLGLTLTEIRNGQLGRG